MIVQNNPDRTSTVNCHKPEHTDFSDRRLKKDVQYLTSLENGIRLYAFKYVWSDIETYVGVIAQDLLLNPFHSHTVSLSDGNFYAVDYAALGLKMITMSEWNKSADNIFVTTPSRRQAEVAA